MDINAWNIIGIFQPLNPFSYSSVRTVVLVHLNVFIITFRNLLRSLVGIRINSSWQKDTYYVETFVGLCCLQTHIKISWLWGSMEIWPFIVDIYQSIFICEKVSEWDLLCCSVVPVLCQVIPTGCWHILHNCPWKKDILLHHANESYHHKVISSSWSSWPVIKHLESLMAWWSNWLEGWCPNPLIRVGWWDPNWSLNNWQFTLLLYK